VRVRIHTHTPTYTPTRVKNREGWILHWDTEGIEPTREETPNSYGVRPLPLGQPCIYDWYRMFLSPVMGTFGTNRIYTVGRVVRVWHHRRLEFLPRGFDSLRISMQNSSQSHSPGRGRESASLWTRGSISVCGVYRTVAPPIAMQVAGPWPGSCSCGSLTRGQSELCCTGTTMPDYDSWTTWTGKCSHAN